MIAASSTTPRMMFCTSLFTFIMVKALSSVPMRAQPATTLKTPPRPPDQANAAQHHHEYYVEDRGSLHDRHLHTASLANPDEPGEPGESRDQHIFQNRKRA